MRLYGLPLIFTAVKTPSTVSTTSTTLPASMLKASSPTPKVITLFEPTPPEPVTLILLSTVPLALSKLI